jgi:ketosteroid isomerase-like protein
MADGQMIEPDLIARNLEVVQAHLEGEGRDPASVMSLYTDDIVLEVPGRGLRFDDKAAIEANYIAMFGSMSELEMYPLDRFATADRVFDDCRVRFTLTGTGIAGAPVPLGTRVELRLLHVFEMHGGLIARETVHESWKVLA